MGDVPLCCRERIFLDESMKDMLAKGNEVKLENFLWFAIMWRNGCVADRDGRAQFDEFLRDFAYITNSEPPATARALNLKPQGMDDDLADVAMGKFLALIADVLDHKTPLKQLKMEMLMPE